MEANNIFEWQEYQPYVEHCLGGTHRRTGKKLEAATALGCHSGYLSRVLKGAAHLSLEQAEAFNSFMGHTPQESHYFLLLVQKDRSGTQSLKAYFQNQIDVIKEQRRQLHLRLGEKRPLSGEHEAKYYSQWYYSAIHVLLAIEKFQSMESLRAYLKITKREVSEALDFLVEIGLAIQANDKYRIGPSYLYLGKNSPNLPKHHTNWRICAVQSLGRKFTEDLHFSGALTLNRKDAEKYREILRTRLEHDMELFKSSANEDGAYALCLDFFEIGSSEG